MNRFDDEDETPQQQDGGDDGDTDGTQSVEDEYGPLERRQV